MERKEGAQGFQESGHEHRRSNVRRSTFAFYTLKRQKRGVAGSFLHLVELQEVVGVVLDDEQVVLLGQLGDKKGIIIKTGLNNKVRLS